MLLSDSRADAAGYFPRGSSVLRRIHGERAVGLFYGQRALCIGALHPIAFTGTYERTAGKLAPFKRLAHTGRMFEEVIFGTRNEADEALAFVHRLHERVVGEMPDAAGPRWPAGTPYSAFDPELMLWTVAVIADSAPYFYELFVRRLSGEERETLHREYMLFAQLFGMPAETAPATHADFRRWYDGFLASDRVHLTPDGRETGYTVAFEIPLPRSRQPAKRVHDLLMLGSLPPRVRELYGLEFGRAQQVAFRATVAGLKASRPVAPRAVRRGRCVEQYDLVARTERERAEAAAAPPGAAASVRVR